LIAAVRANCKTLALLGLSCLVFLPRAGGADRPQWGAAWSRNMVSDETNLPASFDPKTGRNVKWTAALGSETHSSPVVAGGRIYLGTNNEHPRDPGQPGDRGVLFCLDEASGKLLWQLLVPKRTEDIYFDWPRSGICSPPTVEGDRAYVVNNRGEVLCLDAKSELRAPTNSAVPEAKVIWKFDLTAGAGIWSHDAAHSSILIRGNHLYLNTGTGVDNTHKVIRTPDAPSLVVLEKTTGKLLARENEGIAPNIFHSTWAAPSLGEVNGKTLIFFSAGNGIVFAFEPLLASPSEKIPLSLKKVWQFDFDPAAPKADIHKYLTNRREGPSDFFGMPVFRDNRLYVAGGGDIWWGKNQAWLKCIDAIGHGEVTTNACVWSYPLSKHVMGTPAVWNNFVFIADCGRQMHCVDAKTGQALWTHELAAEAWASPMVADGKVYLGTRDGTFYVFAAAADKKLLSQADMGSPISGTATAANGVLYVATMSRLYALSVAAGS
jgi:outer membrane protein assembly factor BamB